MSLTTPPGDSVVFPALPDTERQLIALWVEWAAIAEHGHAITREARHCQRPDAIRRHVQTILTLLNGCGITPLRGRRLHTPKVSPRELQVVTGISEGLTTAQIARDLNVQQASAAATANRAAMKLGAHTRAHTIARAFQQGLLK